MAKLTVTAFHNTKLGCYTKPEVDDRSVDVIKQNMVRSLKAECLSQGDETTLARFDGIQFCKLGVYDDETGIIEPNVEVLLDCGSVINDIVSIPKNDQNN